MSLRSAAKQYTPDRVKRYFKSNRRKRKIREAEAANPVSPTALSASLLTLGVRPGGLLMVHSSMESLRSVIGGPIAIIQALRDALGPDGTLIMPTFPFDSRMSDYVTGRPVFDPINTPSRVGLLTEIFRRLPEIHRSLHPTHSVAALGPKAEWLVQDHHRAGTIFGPGTPFTRLVEAIGQVLMLGVDLDRLALVHAAEDIAGERFPVSVYEKDPVVLRTSVEPEKIEDIVVRVHASEISRRRSIPGILKPLSAQRAARKGTVQNVDLALIEAQGLVEFLVAEAKRGRTIYGGF